MSINFLYHQNTAVVKTDKGLVRGYSYNGMKVFKGIPYAKAARFQAPEELASWEGTLDATSFGYVCPLLSVEEPKGELLVPHRYWIMNENCQNLNIWTPDCDGEKRPVMVWLHGGGYSAGSAIEHQAYEGENMCRYGQVVVVSINHRLNILGYFDASSFGEKYKNSANAGTDDIVAALKWIQKNIEAFGGDPSNVTLFGQSGGGAKITTLLQTPAADGLFARGINMSGVIGPVLKDSNEGSGNDLVLAMMKEIGTENFEDLANLPYDRLAEAYNKVKPSLAAAGLYTGCAPRKNDFYHGDPSIFGFRPETSQIPLLVGSVFGEFNSFSPTPYEKQSLSKEEGIEIVKKEVGDGAEELIRHFEQVYPERNPVDLLTLDFVFRLPELSYIRQRSKNNNATYSYFFNLDFPIDGGRTPWHCSDIPFVFHNTQMAPYSWDEGITEKMEEQIFATVMAFARTGNPNHEGLPYWPASTETEEKTMIFDKNTRLMINHDEDLIPAVAKAMLPVFLRRMKESQIQH